MTRYSFRRRLGILKFKHPVKDRQYPECDGYGVPRGPTHERPDLGTAEIDSYDEVGSTPARPLNGRDGW